MSGQQWQYVAKPPMNNGEAGEEQVMWRMRMEAHLSERGLADVLDPNFESTLPTNEADVLDETVSKQKVQADARRLNTNAMNALVQALGTAALMRMVFLEKKRDAAWPSGKFSLLYREINELFAPEDDVAEMEMEDEMSKLKLDKKKDPKTLLEDMAAIEVRYGCALSEKKKAAVIIRAGKKDYATIMAVTGTSIRGARNRAATAKELTLEMHKQWRIQGNVAGDDEVDGDEDDDDDGELETALAVPRNRPRSSSGESRWSNACNGMM